MSEWTRLGVSPPGALADARSQAHWAAQAVAAVGATLLDAQPDDFHTALTYESGLLWSQPVGTLRVGLGLFDLTVVIASADGTTPDGYSVVGKTLGGLIRDIRMNLTRRGRYGVRDLVPPKYELPGHPLGRGATFEGAPAVGLQELAAWYDDAAIVLAPRAQRPNASPLRCWPHHFDLATLLTVSQDPYKTVGLGMSPGDRSYSDPYFYVTPWPYPASAPDEPLPEGAHWHTEGWIGAVLTTDAIRTRRAPDDQRALVEAFLDQAVEACTRVLV